MTEPDLLTQAQAALMLGVGRDLVRRWIAAGTLPHFKDPETGRPILSRTTINAWLDERGRISARGAA